MVEELCRLATSQIFKGWCILYLLQYNYSTWYMMQFYHITYIDLMYQFALWHIADQNEKFMHYHDINWNFTMLFEH